MTPGQALAAKRAELGLAIEQAAAATRIQAKYIRALEADDLDRIPARVFAKGYLRTYAIYLDLDADPLVRGLPSNSHGLRMSINPPKSSRPKPLLTSSAVAAAGIVLLVGALAGYAGRQFVVNERAASTPIATAASTSPAVIQIKPTPEFRRRLRTSGL